MRYFSSKLQGCLGFVALALTVIVGVNGCSWDQSVFDIFVSDDKVEACKGLKQINLKIGDKIIECKSNSNDENCLKYADAFEYEICPGGYSCEDKICISPEERANKDLLGNFVICNGTPINPASDTTHCGASGDCLGEKSGSACKSGESCQNGECKPGCLEGQIFCDGKCVDPKSDMIYCGAKDNCTGDNKGKACESGTSCQGGSCKTGCLSTQKECKENGKPICIELSSVHMTDCGKCEKDYANCDGSIANGCEVYSPTDMTYCGAKQDCNVESIFEDEEKTKVKEDKSEDPNYAGRTCKTGTTCQGGTCQAGCLEGQVLCDDKCIIPSTDMNYCGATGDQQTCENKGQTCKSGTSCQNGVCEQGCIAGQILCDGQCVSPSTDMTYCGASGENCENKGESCKSGSSCQGGQCVQGCIAGQILCDDECISPSSDMRFCGATGECKSEAERGKQCPTGTSCQGGKCVKGCLSGQILCDDVCIIPSSDMKHCGAKGNCSEASIDSKNYKGSECGSGTSCQAGICKQGCVAGQIPCNGDCITPGKDMTYCGASGETCDKKGDDCTKKSGTSCQGGECKPGCLAGQANCKDSSGDLCVTLKDVNMQTCSECLEGYADVDKKLSNGCEINLNTDPLNCGAVNNKCKAAENCTNGECKSVCSNTEHLYDGKCEPNSVDNCGSHGNKCSSLTGWSEGQCKPETVTCVPTKCIPGYHLDSTGTDKKCVADTNKDCGEVGKKCSAGEVCTVINNTAKCSSNCGAGEVLCKTNDVTTCADPNTSTSYCGANDDCTTFKVCSDGEACVAGDCVKSSCSQDSNGNQLSLCVVNGVNQCINLSGANSEQCGACNFSCSQQKIANASSNTCKDGKCYFTCNTGYTNCAVGTEEEKSTAPICIKNESFLNDSNNCKNCNNKCEGNTYCVNGECVTSKCAGTKTCLKSDGTCAEPTSKTQCGTQCIDCTSQGNAADGTCNNGVCTITKCADGYHLKDVVENDVTKVKCEKNSNTECGKPDSKVVTNCNGDQTTPYNGGVCNASGTCTFTSCNVGYHLSSGVCEQDSPTSCGQGLVNCTQLEGWSQGDCINGQCKASSCKTNEATKWCLSVTGNSSTCVNGGSNAVACGPNTEGKCSACAAKHVCVNGQCIVSQCDDTVCFYEGTTCSNTPAHCGRSCTNCNQKGNASAGTCSDSGSCVITACAMGYHLSGTEGAYTCAINTATSCAPVNSNEPVDCTQAPNASAVCNSDGTCSILACNKGFHKNDTSTECVADGDDSCGGIKCSDLTGWGSGSCVNGSCQASTCADGYCKNPTTLLCESNLNNSNRCGADCTKCQNNTTCNNGSCTLSPCTGTNSNKCYKGGTLCENDDTHCGPSCTNCKTVGHAANGTCSDAGVCTITECSKGYHMVTSNGVNSCEANSDSSCGSTTNSNSASCNSIDLTHVLSGICKIDGTCQTISCQNGYYLDSDSTCKPYDENNCGGKGIKCDKPHATNTCSSGTCTFVCDNDYTNVTVNGTSSCDPICDTGSYSSNGAFPCTKCPAGKFASGKGATSCQDCEDGKIAENPGSASCTACPSGSTSNNSHTQCVTSDECTGDTNCSGDKPKCNTDVTPKVCVACLDDDDCDATHRCDSNQCVTCSTDGHCCRACNDPGQTPTWNGSECVCQ